ncbi:MAG: LPS assembly lipoprotein LptE [Elusimicrobiota bacterium]
MKRILISFVMVSLFLLAGCASAPKADSEKFQEPVNVYLTQFSNDTVYYGLESALTNIIINELMSSRYVVLTNKETSEYYIEGRISDYKLMPLTFSKDNEVEEYQLLIFANVIMKRTSDEEVIWREKGITGDDIFFTSVVDTSGKSDVTLEKEAQTRALKYLAEDIAERISERKE